MLVPKHKGGNWSIAFIRAELKKHMRGNYNISYARTHVRKHKRITHTTAVPASLVCLFVNKKHVRSTVAGYFITEHSRKSFTNTSDKNKFQQGKLKNEVQKALIKLLREVFTVPLY